MCAGTPVAQHLSRYTCRSRFPGVFMCSNGIAATPVLKRGPLAPVVRGVARKAASQKVSLGHVHGYCKRGSGGQRKVEKIRATFWDSNNL